MRIFLCASLLVVAFHLSAATAQVRLGLAGGTNYTGFSGDNPVYGGYASDIGYQYGASLDIYIAEDIVLNLQPLLSHQATIIQYDVHYQYDKFDSIIVRVDYIEIPLHLKIIADNQMSYVSAGLVYAIPLNAEAKNNRNGIVNRIKDNFKSYVWKASFGIGIRFFVGKPLMFVELNYSQSLTNLTKSGREELPAENELKAQSIQLTTGILFTL